MGLRTPSYLTSIFILENLIKYGHIELTEEQGGHRILVKGLPSIYALSERINNMLKEVEQLKAPAGQNNLK